MDTLLLVGAILGGLALFIYGMQLMADGLRRAAGARLRTILDRATRNRLSGFSLGTLLGFLAHSGPAMVMALGFINAGLMTLPQSVPVMLGCNLGTTLSMQLISFRLDQYCLLVIGLGFLIRLLPADAHRQFGRAVLGFGLLFLGMGTMSHAIQPHRELLAGLLAHVSGDGLWQMALILVAAALVTAAVQSSGAVIGMCFVLAASGVVTRLEQVYPIVLGAHIGTCSPVLLASLGTNLDARRAALGHLVFNVLGAVLGLLGAPWIMAAVRLSSPDLIRQTANLHTGTMAVMALLVLPWARLYARGLEALWRAKGPQPPPTFLDPALLPYPEQALAAGIRELQRVTRICARSFRLSVDVLFGPDPHKIRTIKLNENAVDEIKKAMKAYLLRLALRDLSRRQAILAQHLDRCMADLERIGDHIDEVCDIAVRQHALPSARFSRETLELLVALYEAAEQVLRLVIESLNPEVQDFQGLAQAILEARDAYMMQSLRAKGVFSEKIAEHEFPAIVGIYFSEYVAAFDRIVKHAKLIALAERQPDFWVKRAKLPRMVKEATGYTPPPPTDPKDFLDRLQGEDYL